MNEGIRTMPEALEASHRIAGVGLERSEKAVMSKTQLYALLCVVTMVATLLPPVVAVAPPAAPFAGGVWIDGHWVAGRRDSERFR
ncbi:hypothetical protein [Variovorax sp. Varisp62]|uniref:hypothetical protein n=1 Tax=Variovorax sp. Varisp62 TaxID=3243049 RepID=UPI0039B54C71